MLFHCLLAYLSLGQVLARSIPQYNEQQRLTPFERKSQSIVESYGWSVILGYREGRSDDEKAIQIPLRRRMLSGVNLPVHPKTMRVLTAINKEGQVMPLLKLDRIVCRLEPRMDAHERAAVEIAMEGRSWLGFSLRDGVVDFESKDSKWFLKNIAVSAYQCWRSETGQFGGAHVLRVKCSKSKGILPWAVNASDPCMLPFSSNIQRL